MVKSFFSALAPYLPLINIFLGLLIIYKGRHEPARSTMIWLMVLTIFPVVGFIPYLIIGSRGRLHKLFDMKGQQDDTIQGLIDFQLKVLNSKELDYPEPRFEDYRELVELNLRTDQAVLTADNKVDVFTDGMEKFKTLYWDIDHAKKTIEIQYYIVKSDRLGREMMGHLTRAARRGVKVRFLVDGFGNRNLKKKDVETMEEAGVETAVFFPSFLKIFNFRLNYRNHRKLSVIDDRIAYIGGFNVGDEYVGRYPRFGYWRDTHLRIEGSAALPIKVRFLKDWYYASDIRPIYEDDLKLKAKGDGPGQTACQLVTSGPDNNLPNIKFALGKMISSANQSIYIQTPYFLPDPSFFEFLVLALRQGVEVCLMVPCKPDHPMVYPATISFCADLLREGAKIYRYQNGFLHAKTVLIDDFVSMVGSANMDERSFALNFEASEIVYSFEVNQKLRRAFQRDVEKSTQMTEKSYKNRPLSMKLKEPICRLFGPLF